MGRVNIFFIVLATVFLGCSVSPDEHRDAAFDKYSLDCVARGIPENTEAHTRCVIEKYERYTAEQHRGEEHMRDLFAEKEATAEKPVNNQ